MCLVLVWCVWCLPIVCVLYVKGECSVYVCVLCRTGVCMMEVLNGGALCVVCRYLVYACGVCEVWVLCPQALCCAWWVFVVRAVGM